ncbi:MAG: hypothetical protein P4L43_08745 [Syntrophobacteraceae bacterium]|nr:hypothetical protein [Syntrophobacteraceae bacterium]
MSNAPKGLPSVIPIKLGGVRSDIADLYLEYDEAARSLRVVIVLAESVGPEPVNPGAAFDDLVLGLVEHLSFELGLPIELPALLSYNDPRGSETVYIKPATMALRGGAVFVLNSNELKTKLSAMVRVCDLLQDFNAAAHIDNPVQQFIHYWGVLTYVAGKGTVKAVEGVLCPLGVRVEPGPKGDETKYARVRSEIAHPADRGVRLADLPARVNEVLPEFRQVVKKVVADRVGLP